MKENQITHREMSSLGGRASAERLTPSQRSERAKKAGKKGGWPKGKPRKVKEMHESLAKLTAKLTNNYE